MGWFTKKPKKPEQPRSFNELPMFPVSTGAVVNHAICDLKYTDDGLWMLKVVKNGDGMYGTSWWPVQ